MSGGTFDYLYQRASEFVDELERLVSSERRKNGKIQVNESELNEIRRILGDAFFDYADEVCRTVDDWSYTECHVPVELINLLPDSRTKELLSTQKVYTYYTDSQLDEFLHVAKIVSECASLMKSVEWFTSGDTGPDDFVTEYRQIHETLKSLINNHEIPEHEIKR